MGLYQTYRTSAFVPGPLTNFRRRRRHHGESLCHDQSLGCLMQRSEQDRQLLNCERKSFLGWQPFSVFIKKIDTNVYYPHSLEIRRDDLYLLLVILLKCSKFSIHFFLPGQTGSTTATTGTAVLLPQLNNLHLFHRWETVPQDVGDYPKTLSTSILSGFAVISVPEHTARLILFGELGVHVLEHFN
jgi:hypothetical protein